MPLSSNESRKSSPIADRELGDPLDDPNNTSLQEQANTWSKRSEDSSLTSMERAQALTELYHLIHNADEAHPLQVYPSCFGSEVNIENIDFYASCILLETLEGAPGRDAGLLFNLISEFRYFWLMQVPVMTEGQLLAIFVSTIREEPHVGLTEVGKSVDKYLDSLVTQKFSLEGAEVVLSLENLGDKLRESFENIVYREKQQLTLFQRMMRKARPRTPLEKYERIVSEMVPRSPPSEFMH